MNILSFYYSINCAKSKEFYAFHPCKISISYNIKNLKINVDRHSAYAKIKVDLNRAKR